MPEATPASDIRFAQFGVKMKFIMPDQVRECILIQRRYMERDARHFPSLARILVAKGYLTKHQADAVLERVRDYELEQATSSSASEETNILTPEQTKLIAEMGPGPDDDLSAAARSVYDAPAELSSYRIIEKIGSGSTGTVYKAHQESMDRIVALKVLPPEMTANRRFVEQFLSEARAAGRLNHPNVIRVHDVGRENSVYYYSMEFIEGRNLGNLIDSEGALPPRRAARIMLQVAQALEHGHKHDIVHREIRPEAIMVSADDQAKLADLGLTKVGAKRFLVGDNAAYVAPEQASGGWTDIRTDLYSLGATFFHALTGQVVFSGATPKDIMRQHITAEVPDPRKINPEVPKPFADILLTLLEKNPDARHQSPGELIDEIKAMRLAGRATSRRTASASGRRVRGSRRSRRRRRR